MRLKALMHDLFKTCGTNLKTVSVNMGRDQSFLSAALMRPAIRTDTLCEIADIVGYEVVLRPKRSPSKMCIRDRDKSCLLRHIGTVYGWYDRLAIQHALATQLGIDLCVNLAA